MSPATQTTLLIAGAYLLGSLSGSLLLGRLRGVDVRTLGTGSAGNVNALRTQGWKFALAAVAFDVFMGALAAWLTLRYAPWDTGFSVTAHGYAAAFAALVGHAWPLWHRFRGGKGGATLVGVLLVLWPWIVPWLFVAWAATVAISGYVGVATAIAGIALVVLAWATGADAPRLWFAVAAALVLLITHRDNLRRLFGGSEARFERARLLHRIWRRDT